jgi:hypothetical protein
MREIACLSVTKSIPAESSHSNLQDTHARTYT